MNDAAATTLCYRGLALWAGSTPVLGPIDLVVEGPGTFVLLGPSGVGKSSLLRATQRLVEHGENGWRRSGDVLLNGESIFAPRVRKQELARRIGFVQQRPRALGGSVLANVEFALRHTTRLARREIRRRAEEALVQVGLAGERASLDVQAWTLSGGQTQRLAIARAVALDPEVMLMDEPIAALDPLSAERVEEVLVTLARSRLVVLVTHKVGLAVRVADSAAFMLRSERGARLAGQGPAPAVFEEIRDPVAREFIRMGYGQLGHPGRAIPSDPPRGGPAAGTRLDLLRQVFLFVCGGNTSRSPMAQAICHAELAHLLGISPEEAEKCGVRVESAGLAARPGGAMCERSRRALRELGFKPHDHTPRDVSEEQVCEAGAIYCMTEEQCGALVERFPAIRGKVCRLDPVSDVEDPSTKSDEIFFEIAKRIRDAVRWRLAGTAASAAAAPASRVYDRGDAHSVRA
jgi:phosphate transport system ATP-binding protein